MSSIEITEQQAIALAESGFWEAMTPREIAEFQMNTERLCMPFAVFHEAVEEALGRPVWTHEFAFPDIRAELLGNKPAPTMEEIVGLIPEEKRIILNPHDISLSA